jgi:hypothetical protein
MFPSHDFPPFLAYRTHFGARRTFAYWCIICFRRKRLGVRGDGGGSKLIPCVLRTCFITVKVCSYVKYTPGSKYANNPRWNNPHRLSHIMRMIRLNSFRFRIFRPILSLFGMRGFGARFACPIKRGGSSRRRRRRRGFGRDVMFLSLGRSREWGTRLGNTYYTIHLTFCDSIRSHSLSRIVLNLLYNLRFHLMRECC